MRYDFIDIINKKKTLIIMNKLFNSWFRKYDWLMILVKKNFIRSIIYTYLKFI